MPARVVEVFQWGGLDGRSNPLAFPQNRSLRCLNWVPQQAEYLKLRFGFTSPTMSSVHAGGALIACELERLDGTRLIIYVDDLNLKSMSVGTGTVNVIQAVAGRSTWDACFANNQLYISNGIENWFTDGVIVRRSGIRSPTGVETGSVVATENSSFVGSWSSTTLNGYQFYMSYYNPTTGHVGNRSPIYSVRLQIAGTQSVVVLSGLPDSTGYDSLGEWVKLLGRTPDGGEVPYVLTDASGNFITATASQAVSTLTYNLVDYNNELPTRNGLMPNTANVAWALGRMYCIDADDPHFLDYSEAEQDSVNDAFLGRPEQSWAANSKLPCPAGDAFLACYEQDNEIWCFTRNHLGIASEFGGYSVDGHASPYWRSIWPGAGIAGPRAFCKTRYGPYWLSAEKELMTRTYYGPTAVSDEYEAALFARIQDSDLQFVELAYHRDVGKNIDRIYIMARDINGAPLMMVHDFRLKDEQSQYGQGYEFLYSGISPFTFVSNRQFVVGMRDQNGIERLWIGAADGRFYQLEDGDSDNGATYSADYITILNTGRGAPMLGGADFQGDKNISVTVYDGLDLPVADLGNIPPTQNDVLDERNFRYRVELDNPSQYKVVRIQLTSHPADGTLVPNPTNVLHFPLEVYGTIWVMRPEFGAERKEGVSR